MRVLAIGPVIEILPTRSLRRMPARLEPNTIYIIRQSRHGSRPVSIRQPEPRIIEIEPSADFLRRHRRSRSPSLEPVPDNARHHEHSHAHHCHSQPQPGPTRQQEREIGSSKPDSQAATSSCPPTLVAGGTANNTETVILEETPARLFRLAQDDRIDSLTARGNALEAEIRELRAELRACQARFPSRCPQCRCTFVQCSCSSSNTGDRRPRVRWADELD